MLGCWTFHEYGTGIGAAASAPGPVASTENVCCELGAKPDTVVGLVQAA